MTEKHFRKKVTCEVCQYKFLVDGSNRKYCGAFNLKGTCSWIMHKKRCAEYYQRHKEYILRKSKERSRKKYYPIYRIRILRKSKEYYILHKDEILQKRKQRYLKSKLSI